jgi:mannosyltransferase
LVLSGAVVLAAVLRFYGLGHQGFWYDEADTALLLKFSAGQMLGLIPHTESTPPFYYCVAWVWSRIFGDTEAGLRSLSALCGVLLVPVAWATARKLLSPRAAAITALLTACNPLLVWYSQEARAYELVALLCGVAMLAYVYAREEPRPAWLVVWALASVLALATHYYSVIAVAPMAVALLFEQRSRGVVVAVAVVVVCGAALVPLAIEQNHTRNDAWIANSPLAPRLAQIIPQFLLGTGTPARLPLKYASYALSLIGLVLLVLRGRTIRAALPVLLAVSGFVLSLAFVGVGSDTLITRNIIVLWLPAALAVGAGLGAAATDEGGGTRLGTLVALCLCGIGITAVVGVATEHNLQRPDWRPVATALGAGPRAGTRLVLVQHDLERLPLALYMPGLQYMRTGSATGVSELDVIAISSPSQPLCWWGAACNLIPSTAQSSYPVAGFREVSRQRIRQFTIVKLVATRPRTVTRAALSSALSATTLPRDGLLIQHSPAG